MNISVSQPKNRDVRPWFQQIDDGNLRHKFCLFGDGTYEWKIERDVNVDALNVLLHNHSMWYIHEQSRRVKRVLYGTK